MLSLRYIVPAAILALAAFVMLLMPVEAEVYSNSCTVSTATTTAIGHTGSSLILATSTSRAWAQIQVLTNETNVVSLSFAHGAAAVVNRGMTLGTSTEDMNEVKFGRNVELPYVGAVTGITNTSSTTVLITECNY
jgi:hypothetical protein